jgi:hypothetical protein
MLMTKEMMQDIKDRLSQNPQSVTHVLLVSVDQANSRNNLLKHLFQRLANEQFTLNMVGAPHQVVLTWNALPRKKSSRLYWTRSIYSDLVTSQATKQILEGIAAALECKLNFLVTKPLEYLAAERDGVELSLHSVVEPVRRRPDSEVMDEEEHDEEAEEEAEEVEEAEVKVQP